MPLRCPILKWTPTLGLGEVLATLTVKLQWLRKIKVLITSCVSIALLIIRANGFGFPSHWLVELSLPIETLLSSYILKTLCISPFAMRLVSSEFVCIPKNTLCSKEYIVFQRIHRIYHIMFSKYVLMLLELHTIKSLNYFRTVVC